MIRRLFHYFVTCRLRPYAGSDLHWYELVREHRCRRCFQRIGDHR